MTSSRKLWPIAVIFRCVLAGLRVRRPELDAMLPRALGFVALVAAAVAEASRGLRGRPTVSALALIELGVILAFVGWAFRRLLFLRAAIQAARSARCPRRRR